MTTIYWYAVQTRPRAEYAALADINSMTSLEAYLPQGTRQRRTYRGKETVEHPLMPGFIFVGSTVPPIIDAASPDHPHPIYGVLKSKAVRNLVRSPGGGVHPIRPQVIDGWRVNFIDYLRERESAGAFDYTPRQKPEAKHAQFQKGDLKELMAMVSRALFPDLNAHAA
nr:transcription termination/antitermination NusG family protein [Brevundimonas diminuta]